MATSNFQIETYKVSVVKNISSGTRLIKLVSPDLSHGIRVRADIFFDVTNTFKQ